MASRLAVATLIFKIEITPILNLKLHPFRFFTSKFKTYYFHYFPNGLYASIPILKKKEYNGKADDMVKTRRTRTANMHFLSANFMAKTADVYKEKRVTLN